MTQRIPRICSGRCREWVHRLLAALLLLAALPFLLLLYVVLKAMRGRNEAFLYCGERLGKDKRPFTIYKIRTLPGHATQSLDDKLFRPEIDSVLPGGAFLRETRLDELPQLWNVLRGDMCLVGPRPVRPAIYRQLHSTIHNYDRRFQVKPGLTGYAQLLTAHAAPKRIRAAMDVHYAEQKATLAWDICLLLRTVWLMLRQAVFAALHALGSRRRILRSTGQSLDRRLLRRVAGGHVQFTLAQDDFTVAEEGEWRPLSDANYSMLAFHSDREFESDDCINMVLRVNARDRRGLRCAKCYGMVCARRETQSPHGRYRYVVMITPLSDYSRYIIDQYMLHYRLGWR